MASYALVGKRQRAGARSVIGGINRALKRCRWIVASEREFRGLRCSCRCWLDADRRVRVKQDRIIARKRVVGRIDVTFGRDRELRGERRRVAELRLDVQQELRSGLGCWQSVFSVTIADDHTRPTHLARPTWAVDVVGDKLLAGTQWQFDTDTASGGIGSNVLDIDSKARCLAFLAWPERLDCSLQRLSTDRQINANHIGQ